MALNEINYDLASFKKLLGKAHTQQGFAVSEEGISSNIQIAASTIFADSIDTTPVSGNNTLTSMYDTDGVVERIRLVIEPIPDTDFGGVGRAQGWYAKLPSDYIENSQTVTKYGNASITGGTVVVGSGTTFTDFKVGYFIKIGAEEREIASVGDDTTLTVTSAFTATSSNSVYYVAKFRSGKILYETLGAVQVVPPLYGTLSAGSTEYDVRLYDNDGTASGGTIGSGTEITKFDPIDWLFDYYNGVIFVQDPPADNYSTSTDRPKYVDCFIYSGNKVSDRLSEIGTFGIGSGATIFTQLTDTPSSYSGSQNRLVKVNAAGTGLEFYVGPDLGDVLTNGGTASGNYGNIDIQTDGTITLKPNDNTGMTMTLSSGSGAAKFTDNRSTKTGMQYDADYSSGFTARSLVDKAYVDDVIGNSSGGTGGTLGTPTDGTYTDGLLEFTSGTTVADAADGLNELLAALIELPPALDQMNSSGSFVSAKLSFGSSNVSSSYDDNSGTLEVNNTYTASGDRLGIIRSGNITGVLNDDVTDGNDATGIPYENNSFKNADSGLLKLVMNGTTIESIDLSSTTASINGTYLTVSAVKYPKTANGTEVNAKTYRTGTYTINPATASGVTNGYNEFYVYIDRTGIDDVISTQDFVYDPNSVAITESIGTTTNPSATVTMAGSVNLSGVEYYTGGDMNYGISFDNVYRTVYYNGTALSVTSSSNIQTSVGSMTSFSISDNGSGNIPAPSMNGTLPALNLAASVEDTIVEVDASTPITASYLIDGSVSGNLRVLHPFSSLSLTSTTQSVSGILMSDISSSSDNTNEDMLEENYRVPSNFSVGALTYATVGGWSWTSSNTVQSSGSTGYTDGLQQLPNGRLIYPSDDYRNIADGGTISNGPSSNVDYTNNVGTSDRVWVRRFESENTTTQSTITLEVTHNGNASTFITTGSNLSPNPSGSQLLVEFAIVRGNDTNHGWYNPMASAGNSDGVANTSSSHSTGVTTIGATLSTTPRIGVNDYVLVRVTAPSTWTGYISNMEITNID